MAYQLTMRAGPTPGKVFPVEGEDISIGREPGNSVVINDAEISRRHSHIQLRSGAYVVEDLGSTNGTFVNGIRLSGPHALKAGDEISLGEQIKLVFEAIEAIDPNATMVSAPRTYVPPKPAAAAPVQPPVQISPPPAKIEHFAGQVPANTPPGPEKTNPAARIIIIVAVIAVLCILCSCVGFLFWIDSTSQWCNFFPFLFGNACP